MTTISTPDDRWVEVDLELARVRDFFEAFPEDMRADIAYRFAYEMALWGGRDHFQIIGILEEAKLAYRDKAVDAYAEESEEKESDELYP